MYNGQKYNGNAIQTKSLPATLILPLVCSTAKSALYNGRLFANSDKTRRKLKLKSYFDDAIVKPFRFRLEL